MRLKHIKNAEILIYDSSYVIKNPLSMCGNWKLLFNNDFPIEIEIGCGKGNFIINKSLLNPNINYIGIEKYASVLLFALKKIESKIPNLRFICEDAINIDKIFNNEISLLYLNFSDPWPKKRHFKRRLTHSVFLEKYKNIFNSNIIIEMKTDNLSLFEFSINSFKSNGYKILNMSNNCNSDIKTEYEEKFIQKNKCINYVKVVKNKVK